MEAMMFIAAALALAGIGLASLRARQSRRARAERDMARESDGLWMF